MRHLRLGGLGKVAPEQKVRLADKGAAMTDMYRIEPQGIGPAHGTLTIYSAPRAVIRHVEWTIANVLGVPIEINWKVQPLERSTLWGSINWRGSLGTASRLVSELAGWHYLKFELHEASTRDGDGSIYFYIPELGIYRGTVSDHGDVMVSEHQIRSIIREKRYEGDVITEIEKALGRPWDEELECYRRAIAEGDDSYVVRMTV